jgi:hypothetical protein
MKAQHLWNALAIIVMLAFMALAFHAYSMVLPP